MLLVTRSSNALSGEILRLSSAGSIHRYIPSAQTAVSRGNALTAMLADLEEWDSFQVGPGTYEGTFRNTVAKVHGSFWGATIQRPSAYDSDYLFKNEGEHCWFDGGTFDGNGSTLSESVTGTHVGFWNIADHVNMIGLRTKRNGLTGTSTGSDMGGITNDGSHCLIAMCFNEDTSYHGTRNRGDHNRYFENHAEGFAQKGFTSHGDLTSLVVDGFYAASTATGIGPIGLQVDPGSGHRIKNLSLSNIRIGPCPNATNTTAIKIALCDHVSAQNIFAHEFNTGVTSRFGIVWGEGIRSASLRNVHAAMGMTNFAEGNDPIDHITIDSCWFGDPANTTMLTRCLDLWRARTMICRDTHFTGFNNTAIFNYTDEADHVWWEFDRCEFTGRLNSGTIYPIFFRTSSPQTTRYSNRLGWHPTNTLTNAGTGSAVAFSSDANRLPLFNWRGHKRYFGTSVPSSSAIAFEKGDIFENSSPDAEEVGLYMCTTAGAPGSSAPTWKALATLAS